MNAFGSRDVATVQFAGVDGVRIARSDQYVHIVNSAHVELLAWCSLAPTADGGRWRRGQLHYDGLGRTLEKVRTDLSRLREAQRGSKAQRPKEGRLTQDIGPTINQELITFRANLTVDVIEMAKRVAEDRAHPDDLPTLRALEDKPWLVGAGWVPRRP